MLESKEAYKALSHRQHTAVPTKKRGPLVLFGRSKKTRLNSPKPNAVPATMRSSTGPSGASASTGRAGVEALPTQRVKKPFAFAAGGATAAGEAAVAALASEDTEDAEAREMSDCLCRRPSGREGTAKLALTPGAGGRPYGNTVLYSLRVVRRVYRPWKDAVHALCELGMRTIQRVPIYNLLSSTRTRPAGQAYMHCRYPMYDSLRDGQLCRQCG